MLWIWSSVFHLSQVKLISSSDYSLYSTFSPLKRNSLYQTYTNGNIEQMGCYQEGWKIIQLVNEINSKRCIGIKNSNEKSYPNGWMNFEEWKIIVNVYGGNDDISQYLLANHEYFEPKNIRNIVQLLKSHNTTGLIDIGCNLGFLRLLPESSSVFFQKIVSLFSRVLLVPYRLTHRSDSLSFERKR